SSIRRIWRSLLEERASGTVGGTASRTEIRCSVGRIVVIHVQGVQQVEAFRHRLQVDSLVQGKRPRKPQINALEGVSPESVATLNADTVIIPKDVAVRIEAGKFGEIVGSLQGDDHSH